ncbi:MAG: Spy/CpxP family protein refolding chaperone [Candidatus Omnitrophica bacterium]|nr:Spy/CpxP family protein refolding chaperone [Candidatus Omnitrophota bacterium]
MNTQTLRQIGAGLIIFVMAASPVYAMPWGEGHEGWDKGEKGDFQGKMEEKMKEKMQAIYKEIGLSEDQLAQIEAKRESQKQAGQEIRTQLREKQEALRVELDKPETDQAKVDSLIDQIGTLMTEKIRHRSQSVLDLKGLLTPEQFAQMQEKKQEMRQCRKGQHGGRGKHHKMGMMDDGGEEEPPAE